MHLGWLALGDHTPGAATRPKATGETLRRDQNHVTPPYAAVLGTCLAVGSLLFLAVAAVDAPTAFADHNAFDSSPACQGSTAAQNCITQTDAMVVQRGQNRHRDGSPGAPYWLEIRVLGQDQDKTIDLNSQDVWSNVRPRANVLLSEWRGAITEIRSGSKAQATLANPDERFGSTTIRLILGFFFSAGWLLLSIAWWAIALGPRLGIHNLGHSQPRERAGMSLDQGRRWIGPQLSKSSRTSSCPEINGVS